MKRILFAIILAMAIISSVYSQEMTKITSTKQAVDVLRENRFMLIYKWQECDKAKSVELLVDEITKVVPLSKQECDLLSAELLMTNTHVLRWSVYNKLVAIAPPTLAVLEDNLSSSDYKRVSDILTERWRVATDVFCYLENVQKNEEGWVVRAFGSSYEYINNVYDYFDI